MHTNTSLEIITEEDLADDAAAQPKPEDQLNQTFQRTHSSFQNDIDQEDFVRGPLSGSQMGLEYMSPSQTMKNKNKGEDLVKS